jgi:nitroreductase
MQAMTDGERARERIAFLRRLRAVREFRAEPVPEDVLADILEVGRWSGSSMNRQPWELVVVRDREMLRALAALEGYVKHLEGAAFATVLVMAGDPNRYDDETYDEGRLSERLMLAAAAHSVGACIGWFAPGARAEVKRLLAIPEGRLVRTAISFGYPAEQTRRDRPGPARKSLDEIVHYERYR